jgi:hypothetical protein
MFTDLIIRLVEWVQIPPSSQRGSQLNGSELKTPDTTLPYRSIDQFPGD